MATTRYRKPKGSLRMNQENDVPINIQWREKAACQGEPIDSFFPVSITKSNIDETTRIYSLCERCPVIVDCMHEALLRDYIQWAFGLLPVPRWSQGSRRSLRP